MKIVFMGTPDLAAEVLETMMKNGCEVTLAVTQPDRPRGRGRGVIKTPVHECADRWGIPVFSPVKVIVMVAPGSDSRKDLNSVPSLSSVRHSL